MPMKLAEPTLQRLLKLDEAIGNLSDYRPPGSIISLPERYLLAGLLEDGHAPAAAAEMVQSQTPRAD